MGFKCHDKRLQALSGRKIKSKSFVDMITSTTTSFVQVSVQVSAGFLRLSSSERLSQKKALEGELKLDRLKHA